MTVEDEQVAEGEGREESSESRKPGRYSPWVKEQVRQRYRLCITVEDKLALAKELGIVDEDGNPSLSKLY